VGGDLLFDVDFAVRPKSVLAADSRASAGWQCSAVLLQGRMDSQGAYFLPTHVGEGLLGGLPRGRRARRDAGMARGRFRQAVFAIETPHVVVELGVATTGNLKWDDVVTRVTFACDLSYPCYLAVSKSFPSESERFTDSQAGQPDRPALNGLGVTLSALSRRRIGGEGLPSHPVLLIPLQTPVSFVA